MLGHIGHQPRAFGTAKLRSLMPVELQLTRERQQACQSFEQGALARAVWPEQSHHLTRPQGKGNPVE